MRKLIIVLITCAAMFGGIAVQAQSVELRDALSAAAEQQRQGNLAEALETLKAIQPTVSDRSSPNYFLDDYFDDHDLSANEFYLRDAALGKLVLAFLEKQQFDNAVTTAQNIANQGVKNTALLNVLKRHCEAALNSPEEFDRLQETLERIENIGLRDDALLATASLGIDKDNHGRTKENETAIRSLLDLIESPSIKARGLLSFAEYLHRTDSNEPRLAILREARNRRLAVLREVAELLFSLPGNTGTTGHLLQIHGIHRTDGRATEALELLRQTTTLLLSLPDSSSKLQQLQQIERTHRTDGREGEAEEIRQIILATTENINRINAERIQQEPRFHRSPFVDEDEVRFNQYLALLRQGQADADIFERARGLAEDTADPSTRANRLATLLEIERRSPNPSDVRVKALFDRARQAALEIEDPNRRIDWLSSHHHRYTREEVGILLNDIVEVVLSAEATLRDGRSRLETVFRQLASRGDIDRLVELVFSERIPSNWQASLYGIAGSALLNISDNTEFTARENDLRKLIDLIESPQVRFNLLEDANSRHRLQTPEDWLKRAEAALAIPDPRGRFSACDRMIGWAFSSVSNLIGTGTTTWQAGRESEYLPLLLDAMEKIAKAATDINEREEFYRRTLWRANNLSAWDEQKRTEWRKEHEAIFVQVPNASDRWNRLYQQLGSAGIGTPAERVARNNRLLAALRDIPVEDYEARLNAFWLTAQRAINDRLLDKSQAIIDEALSYIATIPEQDRHSSRVASLVERIHSFNDMRLPNFRRQMEQSAERLDNQLATAARVYPENHSRRLSTFWGTSQSALDLQMWDKALEITTKALAYIETMSEQERRSHSMTRTLEQRHAYLLRLLGELE
jgi:hypothetical protein